MKSSSTILLIVLAITTSAFLYSLYTEYKRRKLKITKQELLSLANHFTDPVGCVHAEDIYEKIVDICSKNNISTTSFGYQNMREVRRAAIASKRLYILRTRRIYSSSIDELARFCNFDNAEAGENDDARINLLEKIAKQSESEIRRRSQELQCLKTSY